MLEYLILGIIQGVFEWIPISSEGVVALASQFFGVVHNPVDLAIFLHAGTTLAVLVYFWRDWIDVVTLRNRKLLKFLVIATVVSLVVGFPVYKVVRNIAIGSGLLFLMGLALLVTGILQSKRLSFGFNLSKLAVVAGALQGLASIPGLSRSGSTIFGLSLGELDPHQILKYSYMMSVPVIITADVYLILQDHTLALDSWPALITSFVVGIVSLHLLLNLSKKVKFSIFAFAFGILCILGALVSLFTGV